MKNFGHVSKYVILLAWPDGLFNKLGRVFGALSAFALLRHGFEIGLSAVFIIIFDYYELILSALLGWLDPFIEIIIFNISSIFGHEWVLFFHWKHIFILLGVYIFRAAGVDFGHGLYKSGALRLFWGVIILIVASSFTGSIQLSNLNVISNFFIAFIPLLFIIIHDIVAHFFYAIFMRQHEAKVYRQSVKSFWSHFKGNLYWITVRGAAGIILIVLSLSLLFVFNAPSPGLGVLYLQIFVFSLYWIWVGSMQANIIKTEGENWSSAFIRAGGTKLGSAMLGVFFWLGVFIICNAGLSLYS